MIGIFSPGLQAIAPFVAGFGLRPASSVVEICRVDSDAEAARRDAVVLEEIAVPFTIARFSWRGVVFARPVVCFVVGWSLGVLDEGDGAGARNGAALWTSRVLRGRSAWETGGKRHGRGYGRHTNAPGG